MHVQILDIKTDNVLHVFKELDNDTPIHKIKCLIQTANFKLPIYRQSLRLEPRGKQISDDDVIGKHVDKRLANTARFYVKDLGPQVAWTTVFLAEYAGPLLVYALIYFLRAPGGKPPITNYFTPMTHAHWLRRMALACWSFHYAKRIAETLWVHRFSHSTMPLMNLFKNCTYYWGFAAFVSYFTNHHQYTSPMYGIRQVYLGLAIFLFGETGNFLCHLALRWLRPAASRVRRIPQPIVYLPQTWLFSLVVCPNYTYEAISWLGFTIMTQTLPAAIFTVVGFGQMSIWALGKLRNYRKEFGKELPRHRRAIVPFVM